MLIMNISRRASILSSVFIFVFKFVTNLTYDKFMDFCLEGSNKDFIVVDIELNRKVGKNKVHYIFTKNYLKNLENFF